MRWMTLSAMAVICGAAGAQVDPVQATLRVPDGASPVWAKPGSVDCWLHNNLGSLVTDVQGVPRVDMGYQAKAPKGGGHSDPPPHPDEQCHGSTANHSQSQKIAGKKTPAGSPGAGDLLIRLDATQLAATMAKHHLAGNCQGAFKPETYSFAVFNGTPSKVTKELVAKSKPFDLPAAELATGKLTLLASRNSVAPPSPTWVVAVRAIAANHSYESPQLVCTLRP